MSARVGRTTSGIEGLALAVGVAALVTAPAPLPVLPVLPVLPTLDLTAASALAVSAIVGLVVAFAVEMEALRQTSTRTVAVLFSWEPALGALVCLVLLGQVLSPATLAGVGAVVLAGCMVAARSERTS